MANLFTPIVGAQISARQIHARRGLNLTPQKSARATAPLKERRRARGM
jgi:hypothetical protein